MTPAEQKLWLRIQRRASLLQPALAAAMLGAFEAMRTEMGEAALARAIEIGADEVFRTVLTVAAMEVALQPVRERMRQTVSEAVRYFARDIPLPPRRLGPTLSIGFDMLNPRVIDAIRQLETRVMTTLKENIREAVRQQIQAGLEAGMGTKQRAIALRQIVGLAPNQELAVRNFEAALRGGPRVGVLQAALDAKRRDRRFDATLERIRSEGGMLSKDQIQKMTAAYRKRMLAFHAETVSRTATLDSLRLGQRLSWKDAVDKGIIVGADLMKQRIGVDDARERPEHRAINNQVRHADEPYSNGEIISGDDSWNCRCIDRYYIARGGGVPSSTVLPLVALQFESLSA